MRFAEIVFAIVLLALSFGGASALTINVEQVIPSGTQWTASVDYSISDGNELKIFLDDELLFDIFSRSSNVIVDEAQKSTSVLAFNNTKNKLVLSMTGESEGTKVLSAKIFSGPDQTDSVETSIDFFRAISYYERNELDNKISSLEQTISSLRQDLNSKQAQINSINKSEKEFLDSLRKLNTEISSLQQDNNSKQEALQKVSADLNELVTQRELQNNPLTGLLSFGSPGSLLIGTIFLIAIAGIGLFAYTRTQKDSLYKK